MRTGRFITFEGPEGSGKSTQARRLVARLREMGAEVVHVREPGGTPTGEAIRRILQHDEAGEPLAHETELFLFAASRAQLVRRVILPALERGAVVVCDRFADSTTAYQGFGRGLPMDALQTIRALAVDGAEPDLTLLLDIPVALGFERVRSRQQDLFEGVDRIEREELAFHERVREGYLQLARENPRRFRRIDASRDPEQVAVEVWEAVQDVLR
ncbi:MAG: dTMP kinase [Kiritimatiellae bacterium]|nr:dTMP kinase [Kiritimatiellia bacterium]MDW8458103.1 dTMP kinase [Verrucomicrobiota bacterium]